MEKANRVSYLYAGGAILAWSTVSTAFKLSLKHLTPLGLLLFASLTSCLLLGLLICFRRHKYKDGNITHGWFRSLIAGSLNPFFYYLVLFAAYDRLPAQEAQVLNYTWAIVLSLFSIWLMREKFRWRDIVALLLSFTGIVAISTQGRVLELQFNDPLGSLLAVSTSLIWASYWILNMRDIRPVLHKMFLNFLFGSMVTISYALIVGSLNQAGLFQPGASMVLGLIGGIYVGVFEMGLTFILWQKALQHSSSTSSVSNLIFLTPFISLVFIGFLLHEPILPSTLIGLLIIVGSNIWQKRKSAIPPIDIK